MKVTFKKREGSDNKTRKAFKEKFSSIFSVSSNIFYCALSFPRVYGRDSFVSESVVYVNIMFIPLAKMRQEHAVLALFVFVLKDFFS